VSGLKAADVRQPFTVSEPVKVTIEYRLSEMADNACRLPGAKRLDATRIELTAPDMPTAYINFRAAVQAV